eukprot:GDKJ01014234.1.p1 GENE.GDKJ01014234.1~~GDKJ01014234.1.p1  ORF type:complete len:1077 (-),score=205.66 GDKJ01014234.1:158-3220(-)
MDHAHHLMLHCDLASKTFKISNAIPSILYGAHRGHHFRNIDLCELLFCAPQSWSICSESQKECDTQYAFLALHLCNDITILTALLSDLCIFNGSQESDVNIRRSLYSSCSSLEKYLTLSDQYHPSHADSCAYFHSLISSSDYVKAGELIDILQERSKSFFAIQYPFNELFLSCVQQITIPSFKFFKLFIQKMTRSNSSDSESQSNQIPFSRQTTSSSDPRTFLDSSFSLSPPHRSSISPDNHSAVLAPFSLASLRLPFENLPPSATMRPFRRSTSSTPTLHSGQEFLSIDFSQDVSETHIGFYLSKKDTVAFAFVLSICFSLFPFIDFNNIYALAVNSNSASLMQWLLLATRYAGPDENSTSAMYQIVFDERCMTILEDALKDPSCLVAIERGHLLSFECLRTLHESMHIAVSQSSASPSQSQSNALASLKVEKWLLPFPPQQVSAWLPPVVKSKSEEILKINMQSGMFHNSLYHIPIIGRVHRMRILSRICLDGNVSFSSMCIKKEILDRLDEYQKRLTSTSCLSKPTVDVDQLVLTEWSVNESFELALSQAHMSFSSPPPLDDEDGTENGSPFPSSLPSSLTRQPEHRQQPQQTLQTPPVRSFRVAHCPLTKQPLFRELSAGLLGFFEGHDSSTCPLLPLDLSAAVLGSLTGDFSIRYGIALLENDLIRAGERADEVWTGEKFRTVRKRMRLRAALKRQWGEGGGGESVVFRCNTSDFKDDRVGIAVEMMKMKMDLKVVESFVRSFIPKFEFLMREEQKHTLKKSNPRLLRLYEGLCNRGGLFTNMKDESLRTNIGSRLFAVMGVDLVPARGSVFEMGRWVDSNYLVSVLKNEENRDWLSMFFHEFESGSFSVGSLGDCISLFFAKDVSLQNGEFATVLKLKKLIEILITRWDNSMKSKMDFDRQYPKEDDAVHFAGYLTEKFQITPSMVCPGLCYFVQNFRFNDLRTLTRCGFFCHDSHCTPSSFSNCLQAEKVKSHLSQRLKDQQQISTTSKQGNKREEVAYDVVINLMGQLFFES